MAFLPDPPHKEQLATLRRRALERGRVLASRARLAMNLLVAFGTAAVFHTLFNLPDGGLREMNGPALAFAVTGIAALAFGYRIGFRSPSPAHFAANQLIAAGLAPLSAAEVDSLRQASQRSPALAESIDRRLASGGALYLRDLEAALDHLRALSLPLPQIDEHFLRVPELAEEMTS